MPFINQSKRRARACDLGFADEGFTLIELLVVLLIIGILLAIAIPTFLSVTKSANNTASQDNLQTALTGAKVYYTNAGQTYAGVNVSGGATSDIQQIATGLSFTTLTGSSGAHLISLYYPTSPAITYLILTAFSLGTNDCWGIVDLPSLQTTAVQGFAGPGTFFFVVRSSTPAGCNATTYKAGGTQATATSTAGFPSP